MEHILMDYMFPIMQFLSVIVVAGVLTIILFHDPSGGDNVGY
jgi:hypothetical protein